MSENRVKVVLSEGEQKELKDMNENLRYAKEVHSDTALAVKAAEQNEHRAIQDIIKLQDAYMNRIKQMAQNHGIDIAENSKEKWQFDTSTNTFNRVG